MLMPFKDPAKKAAYQRAYFLANREKLIARMRVINAKPEQVVKRAEYYNPDVSKKAVKEFRKRNPEKLKAWWTFNNALRRGKIVKPFSCAKCGSVDRLDGHHSDYSKPLDVVWLCRPCHVEESPR
jgi:hypothetical protein